MDNMILVENETVFRYNGRVRKEKRKEDIMEKFLQILKQAINEKATDVHLVSNEYPFIRVNTYLKPLNDYGKTTEAGLTALFQEVVTATLQKQLFEQKGAIDISLEDADLAFFRMNFYRQLGKLAVSVRILPRTVPKFEDLQLPMQIKDLIRHKNGIILITGATSNGKSTTLASLINEVNLTQRKHIITIEDPIEYRYPKGISLISQREVGRDCDDFASGLRSALRQDPDIILVGEMRDKETIETALIAADTGHLVLSTLHTNSTSTTIERILSNFQAYEHPLIASKLAGNVRGIISQHLIPRLDGNGLACAVEIMLPTPGVLSLIRDGKSSQLYSAVQTGKSFGMITMDESLAQLVKTKIIAKEEALSRVQNKAVFDSYLNN